FAIAGVVVGFIVLGSLLSALPVMFLWNWLMPSIFGLKAISFFQSLGLCVLCSLLFRSSSSSSSK
ncbi:MAG: hypothetical protein ACRCYP_04880, partial [Alphaproteobacteria bacterium]